MKKRFIIFISALLICFSAFVLLIDYQISNAPQPRIISDSTNVLSGNTITLDVRYTVWGCNCPHWIELSDLKMHDQAVERDSESIPNFESLHFHLEPAHDSLEYPLYYSPSRHFLRIAGQFYEKEGHPMGTLEELEDPMPAAKVFRYTDLEVLPLPDLENDQPIQELVLTMDMLSCVCPKWKESDSANQHVNNERYWLEPGDSSLVDIEALYHDLDTPIKVKAKGQVVAYCSFPVSKYSLNKIDGECGMVFRYTKVEVLSE